MKIRVAIFLITFMAAVSTAVAVRAQEAPVEDECAGVIDTMMMNKCAARDYAAADDRLNEVYKEFVAKLEQSEVKGVRKKMVEAQRAWIMFRDAECEMRAFSYTGGSAYSLTLSGCMLEETKKRTEVLEYYLENWPEM